MKDYEEQYDAATQKLLELASQIDRRTLGKIDAQYTLRDITYVLRSKYKDPVFRKKYVGDMPFRGFVPYTKGFCALTTICVYNLYGGADVWLPSAIKLGAWEYAPVVFLRELGGGVAFDPTGDQFAPLRVPYEVGEPINRRMSDMRTPNKEKFIMEIKKELDRR